MDFGKLEYSISSQPNGKNKVLKLTLIGQGDSDTLRSEGLAALRRKRLLRIVKEAVQQGALLGYEDLSALLVTSVSTLKRDIAYFERIGERIPLKGRRSSVPGMHTEAPAKEAVQHA